MNVLYTVYTVNFIHSLLVSPVLMVLHRWY